MFGCENQCVYDYSIRGNQIQAILQAHERLCWIIWFLQINQSERKSNMDSGHMYIH